jgi:hypothetical protein
MKSQRSRIMMTLAVGLICLVPVAGSALTPYSQDFEAMNAADPFVLGDDTWVVWGNVFDPVGNYLYGYGVFPAPNHNLAFSQVVTEEGGVEQGAQQLVIFSDYENADHAAGNLIESNVYQEQPITLADVGQTWTFNYNVKKGNLELNTTALAFIKTVDPSAGFNTTNFIFVDTTVADTTWSDGQISLLIDAGLEGQLLQFGFSNTATFYEGSAVYYDNIDFAIDDVSSVPNSSTVAGATLRQNYPNPFNPMTRIDFAIDKSEMVDISVFDLGGRRVATLYQGEMGAGDHHVIWDGKTDSGSSAPAGHYRYLLKTGSSQVSRSMVLLK